MPDTRIDVSQPEFDLVGFAVLVVGLNLAIALLDAAIGGLCGYVILPLCGIALIACIRRYD
ncbi:MAG: hypothetical protein SF029_04765 [bacterium]|nr:hypothetical protein [bacterium]